MHGSEGGPPQQCGGPTRLGDQLGGGNRVHAGDVSESGRVLGERADRLLDAGVKCADLGADAVAVVEHHLQDRRVMVGEEPS